MKKSKDPSITFVTILYNASGLLNDTLEHLTKAIENAQWNNAEILVVNDGSTDDTAELVKRYARASKVKINILNQPNQGRLAASINGTKASKTDYVSFIGARVLMNPNSLKFLKSQLLSHPKRRVWNCHINVPRKHNLQAQFWQVVTFVAWRRYLKKPRYISYDISDFDYYPKGTGAFICPRDLLMEGYENIDSIYSDEKYSSDDTTLIRYIATKERINMSPKYSADYIARSDLNGFIKHTYDRGAFLLDSYMRPGTRLFWPIVFYFVAVIPMIISVILFPALLLIVPLGIMLVFLLLIILGVSAKDAIGFCVLAPFFAVIYGTGMWRGLWMYISGGLKRAS